MPRDGRAPLSRVVRNTSDRMGTERVPAYCRETSALKAFTTVYPCQQRTHSLQVLVRDNNVDQTFRGLKTTMQREGVFREMKQRSAYEKPSERKACEKAETVRRARKQAARRPSVRVWLRPQSPSLASTAAHVGPACRPAVDPARNPEMGKVSLRRRDPLRDGEWACREGR